MRLMNAENNKRRNIETGIMFYQEFKGLSWIHTYYSRKKGRKRIK